MDGWKDWSKEKLEEFWMNRLRFATSPFGWFQNFFSKDGHIRVLQSCCQVV